MKTHVVLAHPESQSFNGRLAGLTRETIGAGGAEVTYSDLYAMDFDPREGANHYTHRKDAQVFHTQTEQRFNAAQGTLPPEVDEEVQ